MLVIDFKPWNPVNPPKNALTPREALNAFKGVHDKIANEYNKTLTQKQNKILENKLNNLFNSNNYNSLLINSINDYINKTLQKPNIDIEKISNKVFANRGTQDPVIKTGALIGLLSRIVNNPNMKINENILKQEIESLTITRELGNNLERATGLLMAQAAEGTIKEGIGNIYEAFKRHNVGSSFTKFNTTLKLENPEVAMSKLNKNTSIDGLKTLKFNSADGVLEFSLSSTGKTDNVMEIKLKGDKAQSIINASLKNYSTNRRRYSRVKILDKANFLGAVLQWGDKKSINTFFRTLIGVNSEGKQYQQRFYTNDYAAARDYALKSFALQSLIGSEIKEGEGQVNTFITYTFENNFPQFHVSNLQDFAKKLTIDNINFSPRIERNAVLPRFHFDSNFRAKDLSNLNSIKLTIHITKMHDWFTNQTPLPGKNQ